MLFPQWNPMRFWLRRLPASKALLSYQCFACDRQVPESSDGNHLAQVGTCAGSNHIAEFSLWRPKTTQCTSLRSTRLYPPPDRRTGAASDYRSYNYHAPQLDVRMPRDQTVYRPRRT